MQNNRLVSIVLPTRNGIKYLRQSMESCLKQTYPYFELIVVDDQSTDGTDELVREYTALDPRVVYHRNETNRQLPASLNIGFSLAKGDYYTWTSDDNLYSENALEEMIKIFDSRQDISLVYSSYKMINENGHIIDQYGAIPEALLFCCAVGACFLYKKEIHETLKGYDENKFRMEDYDFWLRACTRYRFLFIDQPGLYYYRKHSGNLSTRVYSDPEILDEYKKNYSSTFSTFFREGLGVDLSEEGLVAHLDIFFNGLIQDRNFSDTSFARFQRIQEHFDRLQAIPWEKTFFDPARMQAAIHSRQNELVSGLVNTILFENLQLKNKNPRMAGQLSKPIFWYYREYETLPGWYKKAGHILKILQGNRPITK